MNTNTHFFPTDSVRNENIFSYLKRLMSSLMLSTLVMQSIMTVPLAAAQSASGSTVSESSSSVTVESSSAESSEIQSSESSVSSESSSVSSEDSSVSSDVSSASSDDASISSDASSESVASSEASSVSSDIAVTLTGNTLLSVPENTHPTFEVEKDAEIQSGEELEERLMVVVTDPTGEQKEVEATVTEELGSYLITLEPPTNFVPGKYHVEALLDDTHGVGRRLQRFFRIAFTGDSGDTLLFEQDFVWGVIAFNPDRSVYLPGETGSFSLAVLDDRGRTLCDAAITMTVTRPDDSVLTFTTQNKTIFTNPDCKDKDVTYVPDYSFQMQFDQAGVYTFAMEAQTKNGVRTLTQDIEAQETRLIDVKRFSATRIYPISDYEMKMKVTPSRTFIGTISEKVPAALRIVSVDPQPKSISTDETTGEKTITWGEKLWETGEVYSFSYVYDAPDVSPEFYLVGPLSAEGYVKDVTEENVDTVDTSSMSSIDPIDVSASGTVLPVEEPPSSPTPIEGVSASGGTIPMEESSASSEVTSSESTSSVTSSGTSLSSSSVTASGSSSVATSSSLSSEAASSSLSSDAPLSEVTASGSVSWVRSFISYLVPGVRAQVDDSLEFEEPRQWQIASDEVGLSISGVFIDNQGNPLANKTIAVSLDGAAVSGTADTNGSGVFQITGQTIVAGTVMTLFVDGETEHAVTVRFGDTVNITGVVIVKDALSIVPSSANPAAITTTNLDTANNSGDADIASVYTIDGGMLNVKVNYSLYVPGTFTPASNVNVGSGVYLDSGTITMGSNILTASGTIQNDGGSLNSTSKIILDGDSFILRYITLGGGTQSGVTIAASSTARYKLGGNMNISGALTLNAGSYTFDAGGYNVSLGSDFTADNTTLVLGSGTWTVDGSWDAVDVTTQDPGTSTVIFTGTDETVMNNSAAVINESAEFYNMTFDGTYTIFSGTYDPDFTDQRIRMSNNLVFNPNSHTTFGLARDNEDIGFNLGSGDVKIKSNAIVDDDLGDNISGGLFLGSEVGISQMSGSLLDAQVVLIGDHTNSGDRLVAATYESSFIMLDVTGIDGTLTFEDNTSIENLLYFSLGGASTVDNTSTNADITISGLLFLYNFIPQLNDASIQWIKGNGTVTFTDAGDQVVNLSGATIEDIIINKSLGSVTMRGPGSTDSLTMGGAAFIQERNFDINGNLTINGGAYDMRGHGATLTLSGSLTNKGQFLAGTGTVTLDGSSQTLSGSTAFYNLSKTVTNPYTLTLAANKLQTVSGAITLRGATNKLMSLRSNVTGVQANLKLVSGSTQTIDKLDVRDINSSGGTSPSCLVTTEYCVNSGNNTNWTMGVTITGKVFNDGGSTSIGNNKTVALSLNGGAVSDSATTDAGGMYTLSGSTITGGTLITVFLDGNTEKGVLVTLGSGSTMTGVNLYRDHLIVRSDSGSVALTTANLNIADNSADTDISAIYSVDSNVLNVKSNKKLHVWSGDTFTPATAVNVGSGITIAGTLNMAANAVTLSGAWITTGSFSGSNTVTFDGVGLGARNITSNGKTFYNVTIAGATNAIYRPTDNLQLSGSLTFSSGTWSFSGSTFNPTVSVRNNVTMDNTNVSMGNGTWTVGGNWDSFDPGTWNANNSLLILTGTGKTYTPRTATSAPMNSVLINGYYTQVFGGYTVTRLSIGTGAKLTVNSGVIAATFATDSDVVVYSGARITGPGILSIRGGSQLTKQNGIIDVANLWIIASHTTTTSRVLAATYHSANVYIYTPAGISNTVQFTSGTIRFKGDVIVRNEGGTSTFTFDTNTTDTNFIFEKSFTIMETTTGRVNWIVGDGTITFSGSNVQGLNLKGKTINPIIVNKSAGLVALTGTGAGGGSGATYGLTVTNGTFEQKSRILVNTGTLTIASGGTYKVGSGSLQLKGNLINNGGMMTATTGSVVLTGTNQTLSGSNNFYNLSKIVTSAATLTLASTKLQSVSGALVLQGAAGNRLSLRATSANVQARLKLLSSGTQTIDNVDVKDSNASGGQQLVCNAFTENCADSGNNSNWFIVPPYVSGRVYTDEGNTLMAGGKTVAFSINGGAATDTTVTDAGGQFALSGATMTGGSIITLYLDGNTEKGVTVTLGSGSSMTGVNIYQNRLIVRSDSGSVALTNSHLQVADNNADSDITSIYTMSSLNLTTATNMALFVWAGDSYSPNGTVTSSSGVTILGTFNMDGQAVSARGSWIAKGNGSFNGTNLVTMNGNTAAQRIVRSNGSSFSGVTISGSNAAIYTISGALSLNGNLILSTGQFTFDNATFNNRVTIGGRFTGSANNTLNMGAGTWFVANNTDLGLVSTLSSGTSKLVMTGTGRTLRWPSVTARALNHIAFSGSTTVTSTIGYVNGTVEVATGAAVSITSSMNLNAAAADLKLYGATSRVTGDGQLNIVTSGSSISVQHGIIDVAVLNIGDQHSGSAMNRIAAARYDSPSVNIDDNSTTAVFQFSPGTTTFYGAVSIYGITALRVENGATDPNLVFKDAFSVGGGAGTLTWQKGAGTVTVSGTAAQDVYLGGYAIEDISVDKASGSARLTSSGSTDSLTVTNGTFEQLNTGLTVSGSVTVAAGSSYLQGSGTLTLVGNLINNGTFRATTGSLLLSGANQTLSGSNYLYNLTKSVSTTRTLTLAGTKTQNISGALILNGALSNRLNIRSTTTGVQSRINLDSEGTQTLDYLDVRDNNASGMRLICETSCFDSGNNLNWNFGKAGTGSLNGTAWIDTDGDGQREAGESSVFSNASISLSGNTATGANLSLSRLTNSLGQYAFSGVVVSNSAGYTIEIDTSGIPAGYLRTRPTSSGGNIVSTGSVIRVDFGFVLSNSLSGTVFIDSDEDGQKDSGETSVFSGVTIALTGLSGTGDTINITKLSNANGVYAFTNLPTSAAGLLLVITPPTGYTTTTTNSRTVTFGTGGQIKFEQFGFKLTTSSSSSSSSTSSTSSDGGTTTTSGGARSETITLQIRGADDADTIGEEPTPVSPSELSPEELARQRARDLARTVRDRRDDRLREIARLLRLEDERPQYLSNAEERRQRRLDRLTFLENLEPKPLITLRPTPQSPVQDLIDEVQASLISKAWDTTTMALKKFGQQTKDTIALAADNLSTAAKNAGLSAKALASLSVSGGKTLVAKALELRKEQQRQVAQVQQVFAQTLAGLIQPAVRAGGNTATMIGLNLTNGLKRMGRIGTGTVDSLIAVKESSISLAQLIGLRSAQLGTSASQGTAALVAHVRDGGSQIWSTTKDVTNVAIIQNVESLLAVRDNVNKQRAEALAAIGSTLEHGAAASRDGVSLAFDKTTAAFDTAIGYTEGARHGVVLFLAGVLGVSDRIKSVPEGTTHVASAPLEYKTKLRKEGDKEVLAAFHMNVTNVFGDPYKQTPVVMFSTPKVSVTNDQGIVTFHGIEVGKHRIEIHTGNDVETREIVIEPPSDVTAEDMKPADVVLPVVQIVVTEPQHGSAPDRDTFPPLALLLIGLLAVGNLYTFYHFVDAMQRRRKLGKR